MASTESSNNNGRVAGVATWVHKHVLWLLIGCYLLAAVVPKVGLMLRDLSFRPPSGNVVHAPMLLLAIMLFCAAAVIQWSEVRSLLQKPSLLVLGLLAAWLGPAVLVVSLGIVLPRFAGAEATAGMMVGLALVAAMPVANSSVAWSQNAGGNVALGLGLIVLSIVLSPLATPQLLSLLGFALSAEDTAKIERVVTQFSGLKFIVWVVLPSFAGAAAAWWAGPERIARAKSWIRLATLTCLLLLNYTNASLAMPEIVREQTARSIALPALLAVTISVLGVLLAAAISRLYRLTDSSRTALLFGMSMKHTGLALVLAGEVLREDARVLMMIMLATLLQHVVAAVVDWRLQRTEARASVESEAATR